MWYDLILVSLFLVVLLTLAWPLGHYLVRVFQQEATLLDRVLLPVEKIIYQASGIQPQEDMTWQRYAGSLVGFNLLGCAVVFALQLLQGSLPLNPQGLSGVESWPLAFNTAVSFMTNTNWQAYSGESTLSYLTQMLALTVQNFLSAATGLAVAVALIRGLQRQEEKGIGNFWVDVTRSVLWVLLPLSFVLALVLVQQGVIQNLAAYVQAVTLEGAEQILPMGPVASQEAIKLLGTNGGGFFNANSAHPFENPTAITNFLEMVAIFLLPTSLVFCYGFWCGNVRQGYAILGAMLTLFVLFFSVLYASEQAGNPSLAAWGLSGPTAMEGKEVRFGLGGSSLFATITTAASCGAVNAMHDSLTPLGGMAALLQMLIGEVVIGGVGAGFYGMLCFVLLTVFIVGLMVGRTPEYLGKKIEAYEMKMVVLAVLIPALTVLFGTMTAVLTQVGVAGVLNEGPHGFSEILYAFASAAGNNGSAFAGLSADSLFYNVILATAMLLGRFGVILPILAVAGSLARKKAVPVSAGTFTTDQPLFSLLLMGVILIVGALTFLPALVLGPVVEQMLLW